MIAVIGGLARVEGAWLGAFAFIVINNYVRDVELPVIGGSFNTIIGSDLSRHRHRLRTGSWGCGTASGVPRQARRRYAGSLRDPPGCSGGRAHRERVLVPANSSICHSPRPAQGGTTAIVRSWKLLLPLAALAAIATIWVSGSSAAPQTHTIRVAIMTDCKGAFGFGYELDIGGAQAAFAQYANGKVKNKNKPSAGMTGIKVRTTTCRSSATAAATTRARPR